MDIESIAELVEEGHLQWQRHALERMMERGISRKEVIYILSEGEIIERYPDDHPFPSVLVLGFMNEKPLHAVIGVYIPDTNNFEEDFKTRK